MAQRLARFVDVSIEHRLADLEALVLLDTLRRWPDEAAGEGSLIRMDAGAVARRLRVCSAAVQRALRRLERRRLVSKEWFRGRLHVRLTTALWMIAVTDDEPGEIPLRDAQVFAVAAGPSRGRDRVLLLLLLSLAEPGCPVVRVQVQALAKRVDVPRQSLSRMATRLVRRGAISRFWGGYVVHALAPPAGATSDQRTVSTVFEEGDDPGGRHSRA